MGKLSAEKVRKAIVGCAGNYSVIAEQCGVSRQAVSLFLNKNPKLKREADAEGEKLLDLAENQVAVFLKEGDKKVIMWYLDSKGKERGYGQKMQLDQNIQTDVFKDSDKLVEMLRKEIKTPEQFKKMEAVNAASMGIQEVDMSQLSTGQQEQQKQGDI
jgi:hypothetical protein